MEMTMSRTWVKHIMINHWALVEIFNIISNFRTCTSKIGWKNNQNQSQQREEQKDQWSIKQAVFKSEVLTNVRLVCPNDFLFFVILKWLCAKQWPTKLCLLLFVCAWPTTLRSCVLLFTCWKFQNDCFGFLGDNKPVSVSLQLDRVLKAWRVRTIRTESKTVFF